MTKQTLSIEQMQHLQELGLELKDTMLYWIVYKVGDEKNFVTTKENAMEVIDESCGMLPAYTLQDVLDALPTSIRHNDCTYYLGMAKRGIAYDLYSEHGMVQAIQAIQFGRRTLIDAAYEMLCWLIEQGYVETNKNE